MIPPSASRFLGALLCLSYAVSLGGCKRLQRCPPALTEPPPEEGCVEYHPIHGQGVDEEFHKWIQYRLWPLFDRYLGTKYWGNSNEWFRESFVRMFNWLGDPPHPFEFMYSVGDEGPSIYDPTPFHGIISVPDPDWVGPTRPTSRLDERFYLADCQWNNGGEIWRQWSEMIWYATEEQATTGVFPPWGNRLRLSLPSVGTLVFEGTNTTHTMNLITSQCRSIGSFDVLKNVDPRGDQWHAAIRAGRKEPCWIQEVTTISVQIRDNATLYNDHDVVGSAVKGLGQPLTCHKDTRRPLFQKRSGELPKPNPEGPTEEWCNSQYYCRKGLKGGPEA